MWAKLISKEAMLSLSVFTESWLKTHFCFRMSTDDQDVGWFGFYFKRDEVVFEREGGNRVLAQDPKPKCPVLDLQFPELDLGKTDASLNLFLCSETNLFRWQHVKRMLWKMSHVNVLAFKVFHDQSTQEREAKKAEKLQKEIWNFLDKICRHTIMCWGAKALHLNHSMTSGCSQSPAAPVGFFL